MTVSELMGKLKDAPPEADVLCTVYEKGEGGWILDCDSGQLEDVKVIDPEDAEDTHTVHLGFVRL